MTNELNPTVDQWYAHLDKGELFRVVAVEPDAGIVEIQDFEGALEELEMEEWGAMEIELTEPPEDLTGPFDDLEADDLGDEETGTTVRDWRILLDPQGEKAASMFLDGDR